MGRRAVEKPLLALACLVLALGATDCYSTGDGTAPPRDQLYYPVGLKVSAAGNVLYVVNSDFDLQYNGGTLQSYDLGLIRRHIVGLIAKPTEMANDPTFPVFDRDKLKNSGCPNVAPTPDPLGQSCAPPVDSRAYVRDSAVIGAFATDLLLSPPPIQLVPSVAGEAFGSRSFDRLYAAIRGNASVTWASVARDHLGDDDKEKNPTEYAPFFLECGKDSEGRCDAAHQAGSDPDEPGNRRHLTMPGEPFGMAMSEDGQSIVVTHQNETKTSLFDTGLKRSDNSPNAIDIAPRPSIKFILDGVTFGGVGVAAIPHNPAAFNGTSTARPRPAFLQTSRLAPEINLLRQYPDEFAGQGPPSDPKDGGRPFLDREGVFPVAIGPGGNDSRGIVIDPTPALACANKLANNPAATDADRVACARKPSRVFIANRSPASLLVGEVGGSSTADTTYNPDRLVLTTSIPLSAGPSKLYLAPVVESDGALALRVFVVCFDSATVFVYNPDTQQLESVIRVGLGPFAMAFDPFTFEDVAANKKVEVAPNGIRRFRFGYLGSFTTSFIQILDLDNTGRSTTFERVVYTLGRPTNPKGS